jgi:hypothetical protein
MAKSGRKPRSDDAALKFISLRLTEAEHTQLTREAEELGTNVAQLVRSRALESPAALEKRFREFREGVAVLLAKY